MSGIAILCSGQGGQDPGMFDLFATEPAADPVFAAAANALGGQDPRDVARRGGDAIHRNDIAQILCCTQALGAWAAVGPGTPRPMIVAGYSAGEVPAWSVAGVIDTASAFDLVAQRAALMDADTHEASGLAAIVGVPWAAIEALCRAHQLDVAIINGPAHFIIGGRRAHLEPACEAARLQGASRAVLLPVTVAAHTLALRQAATRFAEALRARIAADIPLQRGIRLVSGIDGNTVRDMRTGLDKLAGQICTPIDWAACMDTCRAALPDRILELGPGSALARMMIEFAPNLEVRSIADFRTLDGVRDWLLAK